MESVGFFITAACALLSAIFVVRTTNLVHAVLWLGITLLGTAVFYAMLGASFLAGVQVLLYVGGVITLMIFGVMITRRHESIVAGSADSVKTTRAALVAIALFGVLAAAIRGTDGLDTPPRGTVVPDHVSAADLGRSLLGDYVLAFEVVSLLLLAAIIGAIVIARKRDPGEGARGFVAEPSPVALPADLPLEAEAAAAPEVSS